MYTNLLESEMDQTNFDVTEETVVEAAKPKKKPRKAPTKKSAGKKSNPPITAAALLPCFLEFSTIKDLTCESIELASNCKDSQLLAKSPS